MPIKVIKILGVVATALGIGASLLGDWAKEKQHKEDMIAEIDKAVAEKFENMNNETEEV